MAQLIKFIPSTTIPASMKKKSLLVAQSIYLQTGGKTKPRQINLFDQPLKTSG